VRTSFVYHSVARNTNTPTGPHRQERAANMHPVLVTAFGRCSHMHPVFERGLDGPDWK
jgi:hypothetical protein